MTKQNDTISLGLDEVVRQVLDLYPRIYFAFHTEHVRDPVSQRLVSAKQVSILDHLDPIEPATLGDLARHLGVTPGTMSVAVDRLERTGYVVRERDAGDARRVRITITAAGLRLREEMSVLDQERVRAGAALLSDVERDLAVAGLRLLAEAGERLTVERRNNDPRGNG